MGGAWWERCVGLILGADETGARQFLKSSFLRHYGWVASVYLDCGLPQSRAWSFCVDGVGGVLLAAVSLGRPLRVWAGHDIRVFDRQCDSHDVPTHAFRQRVDNRPGVWTPG